MGNEKQETIEDVVAEMRQDIANGVVGMWADFGGEIARDYVDRIEAAAKRECDATREKSSQVGNAAKMREALESVRNWYINRLCNSSYQVTIEGLLLIVNAALNVPSRNCDVLSKDEVLKVLDDRSFSKEDTIEWLYAEAKGGVVNGSK